MSPYGIGSRNQALHAFAMQLAEKLAAASEVLTEACGAKGRKTDQNVTR